MSTLQSPDMNNRVVSYNPAGQTLLKFFNSTAFVRGIMGPIGSGKSTACVIEILRRAQQQKPSPDGLRRSRWAIIRNTYPELKTTTLKTWGGWCPLQYGKLTQDSPITHYIKTRDLDVEVLFMALDKPDDLKKLLSLELTGAWINEAREAPKEILDALTGRVGRYPSRLDGGCTWSGIILDTNPPDDQSWWYKADREDTPQGWQFFQQPAGDGPEGENLENLPENYYSRIKSGKDEDWIKVYVRGEYGYVTEGKPVFPMYRDRVHCAPSAFNPVPGIALEIGVDFGLTPAAAIGQKLPDGRWLAIDEVTTDNCGVTRFSEQLAKYLRSFYPDFMVGHGWGDPAGNARDGDERTCFELMNQNVDWVTKPAPSNDLTMRLECVIGTLNRMVDGNPGIIISPKCIKLRKGFTGGYHYRAVKTGNGVQFHDKPAKNDFSHIHDAFQYLLLGGGEHDVVLNKIKNRHHAASGVRMARDIDYDPFASD